MNKGLCNHLPQAYDGIFAVFAQTSTCTDTCAQHGRYRQLLVLDSTNATHGPLALADPKCQSHVNSEQRIVALILLLVSATQRTYHDERRSNAHLPQCSNQRAPNPSKFAPTCARRPKRRKQTCTNSRPQALVYKLQTGTNLHKLVPRGRHPSSSSAEGT